ncbi:MAG: cell division protein ZapE [Gammaproteobacteria bacterium]|jgi:cell division protein ZapE
MSFKSVYQHALSRKGYHTDTAQAMVVEQLDQLFSRLQEKHNPASVYQGLWQKMIAGRQYTGVLQGCYMWGGVGRGKTWLMDLFYQAAPQVQKQRFHFHEFMQGIHDLLDQFKGCKNPLTRVADHMAQQARLICLDEFHVSDITDAMLLYGLLDSMYKQDVVLVMTSNIPPDDLYKNGLQRSRFVPAIALIKQRNAVIHLEGERDYRLRGDDDHTNYYYPLSVNTDSRLEYRFRSLAQGGVVASTPVTINKRPVPSRMAADNVVWFDFEAICGGPRAAADYIVIAQQFDHVIISNIFRMDDNHDDMVKRFINLVDEFYDRKVQLIISAMGSPAELYRGRRFGEQFKRTVSRLEHMKSTAAYGGAMAYTGTDHANHHGSGG